MLALHGIDTYGLEISQKAIEACNIYAETQLRQPSISNFGSAFDENLRVRGITKFVIGDFFQTDWEADCGGAPFDLIYDYTVSKLYTESTPVLILSRSSFVLYFPR